MRKLLLRLAIASLTFTAGASMVAFCRHHHRASIVSPVADETPQTKFRCDQKPVPPTAVKKLLDRNFLGWRFHPPPQEDCDTVKSIGGKYAYPEMIIGDFDGNGWSDYAVLIDDYNDAGELRHGVYIISFLASDSSYRMQFATHDGGDSLLLMRKGTSDFNYEAQHEFTYANDAIFSGRGMGGFSYLYENGKFRAIITSD